MKKILLILAALLAVVLLVGCLPGDCEPCEECPTPAPTETLEPAETNIPTPSPITSTPPAQVTPVGRYGDYVVDCADTPYTCPVMYLDSKLAEPVRTLEDSEHVVVDDLVAMCDYGAYWDLCSSQNANEAIVVCKIVTDAGEVGWLPCASNVDDENVGLFPCEFSGDVCVRQEDDVD